MAKLVIKINIQSKKINMKASAGIQRSFSDFLNRFPDIPNTILIDYLSYTLVKVVENSEISKETKIHSANDWVLIVKIKAAIGEFDSGLSELAEDIENGILNSKVGK